MEHESRPGLRFKCHNCQHIQTTSWGNSRQQIACEACGAQNVALPRVALGGSDRGAIPLQGSDLSSNRRRDRNSGTSSSKPDVGTTPDPVPEPRISSSTLIIVGVLFAVVTVAGFGVDWTALIDGIFKSPIHVQPTAQPAIQPAPTVPTPTTNQNVQIPGLDASDIEALASLWMVGRLAQERIDLDLEVSLVEMRSRGYLEGVTLVEKAIDKTRVKIQEARARFLEKIDKLVNIHRSRPGEVKNLIQSYAQSAANENNPHLHEFLLSLESKLDTLPADRSKWADHFGYVTGY